MRPREGFLVYSKEYLYSGGILRGGEDLNLAVLSFGNDETSLSLEIEVLLSANVNASFQRVLGRPESRRHVTSTYFHTASVKRPGRYRVL